MSAAAASISPKARSFSKAGQLLAAREIGLAAAMNCAALPVRRRPLVAVFATGDELVVPGRPLARRPDQPRPTTPRSLPSPRRFGAAAIDLGIIPDDLGATRRAVRKAAGADILLTIGGASVGEHDLVRAALEAEGIKLDFWKIAMRPGKPMMFATRRPPAHPGAAGQSRSRRSSARGFSSSR